MMVCQICILQLLHRNDTDWFRLDLVSAEFFANVCCHLYPHISCVCGLDNLPSQIIAVFSS